MSLPILDSVAAKLDSLQSQLRPVGTESVSLMESIGRVLAQDVLAFRDSPPLDVSAMDGYAIRLEDLQPACELPVMGIASAGASPLHCTSGQAIKIFTGAAVPAGADSVVPREQCQETAGRMQVTVPKERLRLGQNVRRRGENASRGAKVLVAGVKIDGPIASTLASFLEEDRVMVHQRVRVAILNTGDEIREVGQPLKDWQIRDSNGPLLQAMLAEQPWIACHRIQVADDMTRLRLQLEEAFRTCDAVLLTGGVSMGDTDHVPGAIQATGGTIHFHRIPIRPGKPLLGGIGPSGQLIMGLPGNPVSVAVTFRRFALPLLRHLAGFADPRDRQVRVPVQCQDGKTLDLIWYRLVTIDPAGNAKVLANQGSGDVAALGQSHGFVEIPPGCVSDGPFPYYDWKG